jgi:hypothetical protein
VPSSTDRSTASVDIHLAALSLFHPCKKCFTLLECASTCQVKRSGTTMILYIITSKKQENEARSQDAFIKIKKERKKEYAPVKAAMR